MEKFAMREFLADLETRIDLALKKWKKTSRIENGCVVQIEWQFEQAHIILDIFWLDGDESIELECKYPRHHSENKWRGLTQDTMRKVQDRVGNFAQIVQDPRGR